MYSTITHSRKYKVVILDRGLTADVGRSALTDVMHGFFDGTSSNCRTLRHGYLVASAILAFSACAALEPGSSSHLISIDLAPAASAGSDWVDLTAAGDSGSVIVDVDRQDPHLRIRSRHAQEKKLSRRIDAFALRGQRVLASVHTTLHSHEPLALAAVRMSVERARGYEDAWDSSISQLVTGAEARTLQVALDVPADATSLQVELDVTGDADARFDAPQLRVTVTPALASYALTSEKLSALRALAQLVGYLRFFHPSDEVARLEWPTFETEAVHRLLAANSYAELRRVLAWVVASVAPTGSLYEDGHRPALSPPPRGRGTRLTRWVRIGSGNDGAPYSAFRTGISEPSDVGIKLLKTVPAQGCGRVTVRLAATVNENAPDLELYIMPRRGSGSLSVTSQVVPAIGSIDGDVAPEATEITYGVRIGGEGVVDLAELELTCGKKVLASFSAGGDPAIRGTARHLYSVTQRRECAGCLTVVRPAEKAFQPSRDELDVALGSGLRLHMPLAVWTDGEKTFPEVAAPPRAWPPLPAGDPASRMASVIDIWATLRWFYPYFDDLHIDWDHALTEALAEAAHVFSADELLATLGHLLAVLHDDHAVVYRPSYDNGILPLVFHSLDSKLYVVKGIGDYKSILPRGSVLDSIDGVPAPVVISRVASTISAATSAWQNASLPAVLGEGLMGVMVSIRARQPDGKLVTIRVPRLARSKHVDEKVEDRPASGSEIAPGVYYIDLAKVDASSWRALLPKLSSSRGVICDARGWASPAAFQILAHFIDHEIKSPYWDAPIASPIFREYERSQSSIYPSLPRLSAKLVFVVDGNTASSPETILQYARAAALGFVIGEPTGGTNGDVASFDSLSGLSLRFTGLRALNQDGSNFHGHGIMPDLVVHPTASGLLAGRDEILEAGVAYLAAP